MFHYFLIKMYFQPESLKVIFQILLSLIHVSNGLWNSVASNFIRFYISERQSCISLFSKLSQWIIASSMQEFLYLFKFLIQRHVHWFLERGRGEMGRRRRKGDRGGREWEKHWSAAFYWHPRGPGIKLAT